MKHLKSILEYKQDLDALAHDQINNNEIIETVKEICLELEDEGFTIKISPSTPQYQARNEYYVTIGKFIGLTHKSFEYNDVQEVIDRLKDYLGKHFRSTYIYSEGEDVRHRYYGNNILGIDYVEIFFNIK